MIKDKLTLDEVIDFLNGLIKIDSDAIGGLILNKIYCNKELADHPTVQVLAIKDEQDNIICYKVGMLGILNGLFGIDEDGWGAIAANFEVICPNHHEVPRGKTIEDKCSICDEQLELGNLLEFFKIEDKHKGK